jgi:hypothetical protein
MSLAEILPWVRTWELKTNCRWHVNVEVSRFRLHRTSVVDRPNLQKHKPMTGGPRLREVHRARIEQFHGTYGTWINRINDQDSNQMQQLHHWPLRIAMNHVEDQRAVHSPKTSREQIAWTLVGHDNGIWSTHCTSQSAKMCKPYYHHLCKTTESTPTRTEVLQ